MRAGRLNKRVRIDVRTPERTDSGAEVIEWTALRTVWASIAPARGRELLTRAGERAEIEATIGMRALSFTLDAAEHRLVYVATGEVYNIVSVADVDERHRELQIAVKAGTNDGR